MNNLGIFSPIQKMPKCFFDNQIIFQIPKPFLFFCKDQWIDRWMNDLGIFSPIQKFLNLFYFFVKMNEWMNE
tara:strand:+ start:29 stop:244 length:216 start_codon:yes stop_codon:yes gene_type:complete